MLLTSSPSYQPCPSSPLALDAQQSSPLATVRAKRTGQYKSRGPPRRPSTGRIVAPALGAETPEKTLLRERLVSRAREESRRARERAQARSRDGGGWSSDGEMSSDASMDTDFDDDNEILISRIIAADQRRTARKLQLLYEDEIGSSPGLPEDELEDFFTGELEEPPLDDLDYEAMYEDYMKETSANNSPHQDDDAQMSEDYQFPVTPTRRTGRTHRPAAPRIAAVFAQCPGCQTLWPSHFASSSYTCVQCSLTLSPEAVSLSWQEQHGENAVGHNPLASLLPDGVILVCGHPDCDWLYEE